jgi:hypothetical protein
MNGRYETAKPVSLPFKFGSPNRSKHRSEPPNPAFSFYQSIKTGGTRVAARSGQSTAPIRDAAARGEAPRARNRACIGGRASGNPPRRNAEVRADRPDTPPSETARNQKPRRK